MDSHTTAEARRANVYLEAAETAVTEAREIRSEIEALESRIIALRSREASLDGLVEAMRALLPSQHASTTRAPVVYAPVEILDTPPAGVDMHSWHSHHPVAGNGAA